MNLPSATVEKSPFHSEPSIGNIRTLQQHAMRRTAVISILVVLVGLLLFVVRRPQVWIGHEKIHQNSFSYAGQFSSLKACRSEVEKYGGYLFLTMQVGRQCPMGRVQTDGASQQAMNRNPCRTAAIGGNNSRSHSFEVSECDGI